MKNSMKLKVSQMIQITNRLKLVGFNGSVLLKAMSSFATLTRSSSETHSIFSVYTKSSAKISSKAA